MWGLRQRVVKLFTKHLYLPYVEPVALWTVLFVVAPIVVILYFSFLSVGSLASTTHKAYAT